VDLLSGNGQRDVHQPLVRGNVTVGQVGAGSADVGCPGNGLGYSGT